MRANYIRWAASLGAGFSGAMSYSNHFLAIWTRPLGEQILSFVCLTVLFTLVAYGLVKVAWRWLASFSLRAKMVWGLVSLCIGGMLMLAVPIHVPSPPMRHYLEIVATGDKSPLARASEVWVMEIRRPDGSRVPLSELELAGEWEVRDGVLLSYQNQPASLKWRGILNGDLTIVFVSHPWSGIVSVRWDGIEQQIDLYCSGPENTQRVIALSGVSQGQRGVGRALAVAGLYGADVVILGITVFVISVWLATRPVRPIPQVMVSRWAWLYYALPCTLVWTVWLLAFWPGLMSNDSVDQWGQLLSGSFNDWHPAFHTMTNWLVTRLWLSPAAVALAQIGTLSAVAGWGLARIQRLGTSALVIWGVCTLFALSPVNGTMAVTLWKDIPYSIALLALTLLVLEVVTSDGAWLEKRARWGLLGGVAVLVALYRHNGPVAGFGTLVVLLVYRQQWRRVLAALILALALWLGVRGPLYHAMDVTGAPQWERFQPLIHQVGAHVAAGTALEDTDRIFLDAIRPLADGWRYSCYSVGPTLYDGRFRSEEIEANPGRFLQTWWTLAFRNPRVVLEHLACSSSLIWRVTQPLGSYFSVTALWISDKDGLITIAPVSGYASELNLHPQFLLPGLALLLGKWVIRSQVSDMSWLIWRPAFYLYVALSGVAVMALRSRSWKYLLVAVPIVLHSLVLSFMTLVQELRLQYPVYLIGLLMIGGFFCRRVPSDQRL